MGNSYDSVETAREVEEAAHTIELLTGVPLGGRRPKPSRKQRQEQAARVKRFLAMPAELQEGVLRYGENIRAAYRS